MQDAVANSAITSIVRSRRTALACIAAVAVIVSLVGVGRAHGAAAADVTYRFAGFAEVAKGESATVSIANVSTTTCTADLRLVNTANRIVKEVDGLTVAPGTGALMTYTDVTTGRTRLRPVVVSVADSCPAFDPVMEVYNTSTKVTTQAVQAANPEG